MSVRKISAVLLLSVLIVPAYLLLAAGDEPVAPETELGLQWVMDFDKAKETARSEGKDLLINFTGSDWCGWCKRLDGEVFSKQIFHERTGSQFVYVFLDFPSGEEAQNKVIDPELNNKLREEFDVQGFPTIMLTDANGRPYGRTGYQEGGPEKYLEHVSSLQEGGKMVKALLANSDKTKENDLIKLAFPVLLKQELFSYAPFGKYLDVAEKFDDKEIVAAIANMRTTQGLAALMNTETPDFPALVKFLDDHPDHQGDIALNACWFASQWLKDEGRKDEAKGFLERMLRDPLLEGNQPGQKMIKDAITALEKPAEEGGVEHDHDGDGIPDH